MGKAVWKFRLAVIDSLELEMPEGATILHVHEQNTAICLWALVDPNAPTVARKFTIYGTGHPVPDAHGAYVGTAHMMDGQLVFHLFEET